MVYANYRDRNTNWNTKPIVHLSRSLHSCLYSLKNLITTKLWFLTSCCSPTDFAAVGFLLLLF